MITTTHSYLQLHILTSSTCHLHTPTTLCPHTPYAHTPTHTHPICTSQMCPHTLTHTHSPTHTHPHWIHYVVYFYEVCQTSQKNPPSSSSDDVSQPQGCSPCYQWWRNPHWLCLVLVHTTSCLTCSMRHGSLGTGPHHYFVLQYPGPH